MMKTQAGAQASENGRARVGGRTCAGWRGDGASRILLACAFAVASCFGAARAEDAGGHAAELRSLIARDVGSIELFKVPATDDAIPLPRQPDGTINPRYKTTEEKRYLGKLLFHDPVRTARIDPTFGGVLETRQTGSCDSCHLGEASGKAGQQINFNVGGEGRGYTDENGKFIIRRRPRTDLLPRLRDQPLFPGDALVDSLPTLTDIYLVPPQPGTVEVATPARSKDLPLPLQLLATGRLDGLDSVGRQSPSMIGFAFNNRLLLGGFAGESNALPGGLNPKGDPAQENLTLLLLDAHRMLTNPPPVGGEAPALQGIPAFVKLFREAFPDEAAQADAAGGNLNLLVNDDTVLRATSTFLRTAVTRDTPFDRFLAGNNHALTPAQLRGARLFFTPASGRRDGAGCFACHSGPMLNKQHDDPDVAGVGAYVEQNFVNVGIGDHPLQALNRAARKDANFHDFGRKEITGLDSDLFKFRSLTLRQLKEAGTFFHSGSPRFKTVRDVVEYFNAGIPDDAVAGAAPTLDKRFSQPRGPGSLPGLGLSEGQVDDLTDFLENGLYDPAFSHYDPKSPTRLFELDPKETAYSTYRPDLHAIGANDGMVLSNLAMNNNDPLTRRDEGIERIDVTSRLHVMVAESEREDNGQQDRLEMTNVSAPTAIFPSDVIDSGSVIDTHLLIIVKGLDRHVTLANASGMTKAGEPYLRVFLPEGVLKAGETIARDLKFKVASGSGPVTYGLQFLSGQGNP